MESDNPDSRKTQIPVRKYERKRRLRECDIDPTPQESASGYTPSVDPSRKSSRTACAPHVLCEQFVDVVAPDTESTPSSKSRKIPPSKEHKAKARGKTNAKSPQELGHPVVQRAASRRQFQPEKKTPKGYMQDLREYLKAEFPYLDDPLTDWRCEVVWRQNSCTRSCDPYWYAPCGKMFRSKIRIAAYLGNKNAEKQAAPQAPVTKSPELEPKCTQHTQKLQTTALNHRALQHQLSLPATAAPVPKAARRLNTQDCQPLQCTTPTPANQITKGAKVVSRPKAQGCQPPASPSPLPATAKPKGGKATTQPDTHGCQPQQCPTPTPSTPTPSNHANAVKRSQQPSMQRVISSRAPTQNHLSSRTRESPSSDLHTATPPQKTCKQTRAMKRQAEALEARTCPEPLQETPNRELPGIAQPSEAHIPPEPLRVTPKHRRLCLPPAAAVLARQTPASVHIGSKDRLRSQASEWRNKLRKKPTELRTPPSEEQPLPSALRKPPTHSVKVCPPPAASTLASNTRASGEITSKDRLKRRALESGPDATRVCTESEHLSSKERLKLRAQKTPNLSSLPRRPVPRMLATASNRTKTVPRARPPMHLPDMRTQHISRNITNTGMGGLASVIPFPSGCVGGRREASPFASDEGNAVQRVTGTGTGSVTGTGVGTGAPNATQQAHSVLIGNFLSTRPPEPPHSRSPSCSTPFAVPPLGDPPTRVASLPRRTTPFNVSSRFSCEPVTNATAACMQGSEALVDTVPYAYVRGSTMPTQYTHEYYELPEFANEVVGDDTDELNCNEDLNDILGWLSYDDPPRAGDHHFYMHVSPHACVHDAAPPLRSFSGFSDDGCIDAVTLPAPDLRNSLRNRDHISSPYASAATPCQPLSVDPVQQHAYACTGSIAPGNPDTHMHAAHAPAGVTEWRLHRMQHDQDCTQFVGVRTTGVSETQRRPLYTPVATPRKIPLHAFDDIPEDHEHSNASAEEGSRRSTCMAPAAPVATLQNVPIHALEASEPDEEEPNDISTAAVTGYAPVVTPMKVPLHALVGLETNACDGAAAATKGAEHVLQNSTAEIAAVASTDAVTVAAPTATSKGAPAAAPSVSVVTTPTSMTEAAPVAAPTATPQPACVAARVATTEDAPVAAPVATSNSEPVAARIAAQDPSGASAEKAVTALQHTPPAVTPHQTPATTPQPHANTAPIHAPIQVPTAKATEAPPANDAKNRKSGHDASIAGQLMTTHNTPESTRQPPLIAIPAASRDAAPSHPSVAMAVQATASAYAANLRNLDDSMILRQSLAAHRMPETTPQPPTAATPAATTDASPIQPPSAIAVATTCTASQANRTNPENVELFSDSVRREAILPPAATAVETSPTAKRSNIPSLHNSNNELCTDTGCVPIATPLHNPVVAAADDPLATPDPGVAVPTVAGFAPVVFQGTGDKFATAVAAPVATVQPASAPAADKHDTVLQNSAVSTVEATHKCAAEAHPLATHPHTAPPVAIRKRAATVATHNCGAEGIPVTSLKRTASAATAVAMSSDVSTSNPSTPDAQASDFIDHLGYSLVRQSLDELLAEIEQEQDSNQMPPVVEPSGTPLHVCLGVEAVQGPIADHDPFEVAVTTEASIAPVATVATKAPAATEAPVATAAPAATEAPVATSFCVATSQQDRSSAHNGTAVERDDEVIQLNTPEATMDSTHDPVTIDPLNATTEHVLKGTAQGIHAATVPQGSDPVGKTPVTTRQIPAAVTTVAKPQSTAATVTPVTTHQPTAAECAVIDLTGDEDCTAQAAKNTARSSQHVIAVHVKMSTSGDVAAAADCAVQDQVDDAATSAGNACMDTRTKEANLPAKAAAAADHTVAVAAGAVEQPAAAAAQETSLDDPAQVFLEAQKVLAENPGTMCAH